jgi:hypothetical protein
MYEEIVSSVNSAEQPSEERFSDASYPSCEKTPGTPQWQREIWSKISGGRETAGGNVCHMELP